MPFVFCEIGCHGDSKKPLPDSAKPILVITKSQWLATVKDNGMGEVSLLISGRTNADKITVENHGDGVIFEQDVKLRPNKTFVNEKMGISFTRFATPGKFQKRTLVRAYKGLDTLTDTLTSGDLEYK